MPETRTCSYCGTTADGPPGGLPEGWTIGVDERGRPEFLCVACTRANLRAIEGRLPEEYW